MFDYIINTDGPYAYLCIFVMLMAGSLGLPMPEDLALVAAGALIHFGRADPIIMGIVAYIGIVVGDILIYRIGYLGGPALFRKEWFRRHVTHSRLLWIRSNLERRAFLTILIARHLFYLRTATFLVCGAVRLTFVRFVACDLLAALVTTPVMLTIGYEFAEHYDELVHLLKGVRNFSVIAGALCLVALGWWWYDRRKKRKAVEASNT